MDKDWEDLKRELKDKTAIMGPRSSPVKRNYEDDGAPQGTTRERKKETQRHPICEQWGGAVLEQQGAGEPTTLAEEQCPEEHKREIVASVVQAPITSFFYQAPAPSTSTGGED